MQSYTQLILGTKLRLKMLALNVALQMLDLLSNMLHLSYLLIAIVGIFYQRISVL